MKYFLSEVNKNTFVLFDCLKQSTLSNSFFQNVYSILKNEQRDDALILTRVQGCNKNTISMQVLGLDGAFGEFCGNGALVCSAYLHDYYKEEGFFFLKTKQGTFPLFKENEACIVELCPAKFEMNHQFMRRPIEKFQYAEMLEPHLLIQKELTDDELSQVGKRLNNFKDIFPLGINVNAWHIVDNDILFVKTYERGVQRLTQSCGSGAVCCASFYKREGAIRVKTPGGILDLCMQKEKVRLKGKAFYSP